MCSLQDGDELTVLGVGPAAEACREDRKGIGEARIPEASELWKDWKWARRLGKENGGGIRASSVGNTTSSFLHTATDCAILVLSLHFCVIIV